jgi:hypothetical protein
VPGELHVVLLERHRLAGGDEDLFLHEIDPRHLLGHGMLDLDACVHLHEVERAVLVVQEFHRAGVAVADRRRAVRGQLPHLQPLLGREHGARRLFDQLLVIALHRALALAHVDDAALPVAEELDPAGAAA